MSPRYLLLAACLCATLGFTACSDEPATKRPDNSAPKSQTLPIPSFSADTAYAHIVKQLSFGPRVPMTAGHKNCALWIEAQLASYGLQVVVQQANIQDHNKRPLEVKNIIASYKPEAKSRVMLSAHWDTRPVADEDTERQHVPIPGANDGASGVAVLMEIARALASSGELELGVDFFFWDAEDGGVNMNDLSWCHGSRYWAKNRHISNYRAMWGINLDMVGAKDATFLMEGHSMQSAPALTRRIWQNAAALGYGNYFLFAEHPPILDDHYVVSQILGMPYVNIIHLDIHDRERAFFPHWHTHGDDVAVIDPLTLKAVGETVLKTLFQEPV